LTHLLTITRLHVLSLHAMQKRRLLVVKAVQPVWGVVDEGAVNTVNREVWRGGG
jgi:hypothetical protein